MTIGLFWTLFAGFIFGLLANSFTPRNGVKKTGMLPFATAIAVGMVGALAASYAGQGLGLFTQGQLNTFIASVVGAVVLLAAWHFVPRGGKAKLAV
ncbi:MAG: GlsB/YeaQ/YmgE family stress response membrane protein [Pseudomonadota bacterium]